MRAAVPLRRVSVLAVAGSLAVLGMTAWPATADSARAAITAAAGQPQRADRSNVGATHSPQLLRQLAGPASGARPSALRITGAIAGAVQGVDVASYQHPGGAAINWADVAAAGIGFAAVKATEGTYYQNPYALSDLAEAKAAGLAVGAYAFAIPNGNGGSSSAVAQADYLLRYLGADSATVPIMLDIEYDPYVSTDGTNQCYGLRPAAMVSWISAFDAEIHRKTGLATDCLHPAAVVERLYQRKHRVRPAPVVGPRLHERLKPGVARRVAQLVQLAVHQRRDRERD